MKLPDDTPLGVARDKLGRAVGVDWVEDRTRLDYYALVYNDRVLGFTNISRSGKIEHPPTGIRDPRRGFDYDAMMRGEC
jgi:hypothetical protein